MRVYYRLTKPGIIYGNALTTVAGFLLAAGVVDHYDLSRLVAVLIGSSLVIGSACVCNNYLDRGIDAKMARTKQRALVTGAISAKQAGLFATALGLVGFVTLLLWTNLLTAGLGLVAFLIYVILYGWAKRHSVHGTLVGSLAGAAPPVAGFTAASGHLNCGALILFLILVCWQMPHFYAIAIYRLKDYQAAGIPVLPAVKGIRVTKIQIVAYVIAFIVASALLTAFGYTGYSYLVVMTIAGAVWLWRGLQGFQAADSARWARQMFLLSLIIVLVLSVMLAVGARLS